MKPEVLKIARRTRRWAMRNREKFDCWSDLGGLCAIASSKLFQNLEAAGIPAKLKLALEEDGCAHVYVEVDGYIVDITATQFSSAHAAVQVVPPQSPLRKAWWWDGKKAFKSVKALVAHQVKTGWPAEQIPTRTGVSVDVRV